MLRLAAVILALLLIDIPAFADNPHGGRGRPTAGTSITVRINVADRAVVRDYYGATIAQGKCPPGLSRKANGCLPPGQARKWARGRPLPAGVAYHALPPDLLARLRAPAGARYIRVAADILLIATGTGMVLDAIEDLGRL